MKKQISRILSVGLSVLALLPLSSVTARADSCDLPVQIRMLCPANGSCEDLQKVMQKLGAENGQGIYSVLQQLGGYCPDGCCQEITVPSDSQPSASAPNPDTPAAEPEIPTIPDIPAVKPETGSAAGFNTAYENEVLRLVNVERERYGLGKLSADEGAVQVAHVRAKELVQSFSHTRPNGTSCFTAADESGVTYRAAGENIAYGYSTPEQVVQGWMNSEGHRKNILSSSFSKIGIGCYESGGVLYWTQFFIG